MKRVLLIGAGGIAHRHVAALQRIDTVQIVGVCDTDESRAKRLAKKAHVAAFTEPTPALNEGRPDYVAIFTPRQVREALIDSCIARKLPFFVEKPPCDRMSIGLRLRDRVSEAGIMHSVGFMHRWHEALNHVLITIRNETLSLITIRFQAPLATNPVVETYPGLYLMERSGGLVGDQGIHYIDIARYICGAEVRSVSAVGTNQILPRSDRVSTVDAASWTLLMDNGVLVNHSHTWGAGGWECYLHMVTNKSSVSLDMFKNRASGSLAGQDFQYDGQTDEFELQHRGFLEALASQDMKLVRSPFADAVRSFRVAAEINRMLYGRTTELDAGKDDTAQPSVSGDA